MIFLSFIFCRHLPLEFIRVYCLLPFGDIYMYIVISTISNLVIFIGTLPMSYLLYQGVDVSHILLVERWVVHIWTEGITSAFIRDVTVVLLLPLSLLILLNSFWGYHWKQIINVKTQHQLDTPAVKLAGCSIEYLLVGDAKFVDGSGLFTVGVKRRPEKKDKTKSRANICANRSVVESTEGVTLSGRTSDSMQVDKRHGML